MGKNNAEAEAILLVDDNPTNLQVLYQTLEGVGCKLLVAKNGEGALTIAGKARPDLILLDIMMPGIDGYEVCRQLKSDTATVDIPVIFLSALGETEDKVKGFHLGAVDYIIKSKLALNKLVLRIKQLTIYSSEIKRANSVNVTLAASLAILILLFISLIYLYTH